MSLELELEKAYAAVMQANEPTLAAIDIRLASAGLEQAPPIEPADESQPVGKQPLPNVTLTAKRVQENPPNSGVYEVSLLIEWTEVAAREGSDGKRSDTLFSAAIRPLRYTNLKDMLSAAPGTCIKVLGIQSRGSAASSQVIEAFEIRSLTAVFIAQDLS